MDPVSYTHSLPIVEIIPNTVRGYSLSLLSFSFPGPENSEAQIEDHLYLPSSLHHAELKQKGKSVIKGKLFTNHKYKSTRKGLIQHASPKVTLAVITVH